MQKVSVSNNYDCLFVSFIIGMLGADLGGMDGQKSCHVTSRLALIGGTSTCHMVVS